MGTVKDVAWLQSCNVEIFMEQNFFLALLGISWFYILGYKIQFVLFFFLNWSGVYLSFITP